MARDELAPAPAESNAALPETTTAPEMVADAKIEKLAVKLAREDLTAVTARAEAAGISAADWARVVIEAALKS